MAFNSFKDRVLAYIKAANATARIAGNREILTAEFSEEDGNYVARVSNGVTLVGNSIAQRIETRWGSGHRAMCPS